MKEIYFDFNRYDLGPTARETLQVNADWLRANPSVRVEIEGHTDERGTNEYNLALGARRGRLRKMRIHGPVFESRIPDPDLWLLTHVCHPF